MPNFSLACWTSGLYNQGFSHSWGSFWSVFLAENSVFLYFDHIFSSSCIFHLNCYSQNSVRWIKVSLDILMILVMNSYVEWSNLYLVIICFAEIINFIGLNLFIFSVYFSFKIFYTNLLYTFFLNDIWYKFSYTLFM